MKKDGKFYLYYKDLYSKYGSRIPYTDLLRTYHWKKKRDKIVSRDGNRCRHCKAVGTIPRVENGKIVFESSEVEIIIREDGSKMPRPRTKRLENPTILNVHHKAYQYNTNPWDYPDDDLITLCVPCHLKEHGLGDQASKKQFEYIQSVKVCEKCCGQGFIKFYSYNWYGICFNCAGNGCIIDYI